MAEIEVVQLVAKGHTNKEFGKPLLWSEIQVKRKMQNIYRKLQVTDRTQAVAEAIRYCGAMNEDSIKNCRECCVNMYWAFQHYYEELATIREANKLEPHPETPHFLTKTSKRIGVGSTVA